MKRKIIPFLLAAFLLSLTACSGRAESSSAGEIPTFTPEPDVFPADPGENTAPDAAIPDAETPDEPVPEVPSDTEQPAAGTPREQIHDALLAAILNLAPTVEVDVSQMTWEYGTENDLKNILWGILSERPDLKYAYDLIASVSGETALCLLSYMPYKTGAYSAGLPAGSHTVGSLHDAEVMAQSMTDGTERLSIAITDPSLEVDQIQSALLQAGYGWIAFTLSRDGTEIVATPAVGMTLETCADRIRESFALCADILSEVTTDDMTQREKVQAVYTYITETTAYDFRWYSDRASLPYESTVALGALRDGLAVCGGYAHAFEMLLDMLGVENYTVSGVSNGEYHAWNYVLLDDQGFYCDPIADRGGSLRHFLLTEEELTGTGTYSWSKDFLEAIRS